MTVNQLESGRADPRLSTIAAVARALEMSPILLLVDRAALDVLTASTSVSASTTKPKRARTRTSAPWLPDADADLIDTLRTSLIPRNRARAVRITARAARKARLPTGAISASAIGTILAGPDGAARAAHLASALAETRSRRHD